MKSNLLTENIWKNISRTVKRCKTISHVAVAYFGQGASKMLPLKKGSKLVVDASENAVISGQTSPYELMELYKKGVEIYSKQYLHAKIFVIGSRLFIGSTNVSNRSSIILKEAVFTTTDRILVKDSREFIKSLCKSELGIEWLRKLKRIYKPPKISGGRKTKGKKYIKTENDPSFYVFQLIEDDFTEGYEESLKQGQLAVKRKKKINKRHIREVFEWKGDISLKGGDLVLQVTKERNRKTLISPIGMVIHVEKWHDGKGCYVYLEVPNKRRKTIKQLSRSLDKREERLLKRNGKRTNNLAEKLSSLWH